jgi:thymidylate kinase
MNNPSLFLIVIDGPMGSGKTTTARLLNSKLEGTARLERSEIKRFISNFDEEHHNKVVQNVATVMVDEFLKNGVSVVVEWAMRSERVEAFQEIAKKYNARCFVYELDAPKDMLLKRVEERTRILLDKKELPAENKENVQRNFEKNYSFRIDHKYQGAIVIDSSKLDSEKIADRILMDLKS